MVITIIGWYGTETIGDRAILAGLISLFNQSFESFKLRVGSLYPFFTERTLNEDYSFYKEIINKDIKIDIFDSKNNKKLNSSIKDSDLIVMGGGPLMDLNELFMVEYAFKKAKKLGIKTALLGCGVGPLFNKKFRTSVLNISLNSDIIILRDKKSQENLQEIFHEFQKHTNTTVYTSYDPAVKCVLDYNKMQTANQQSYIAINLREYPMEYSNNSAMVTINTDLKHFIKKVAQKYPDREIRLIPMHYFHIGNDDRKFLNSIALELNLVNIKVQNENLSLKQTIEIFQNAHFNIGMRFHSIVLQTISSGKNYVLDYTEPNKGKTSGFLQDIDTKDFYADRYTSLQLDTPNINLIQNEDVNFHIEHEKLISALDIYIEQLKKVSL